MTSKEREDIWGNPGIAESSFNYGRELGWEQGWSVCAALCSPAFIFVGLSFIGSGSFWPGILALSSGGVIGLSAILTWRRSRAEQRRIKTLLRDVDADAKRQAAKFSAGYGGF